VSPSAAVIGNVIIDWWQTGEPGTTTSGGGAVETIIGGGGGGDPMLTPMLTLSASTGTGINAKLEATAPTTPAKTSVRFISSNHQTPPLVFGRKRGDRTA